MYYLERTGSHEEMGAALGRQFRQRGVSFPLHLDDFQLEHGRRSEEILRRFFPEVCAEIQSLCDAVGADYPPFVAWLLCMGCCMYNLEDNLPAEVRGCTAFACAKGGKILYGRNNDLPPRLRDECRSEIYAPSRGNRFHLATSSLVNGEEGLNEHGLAVAMTFVMTALNQIRSGFNALFIVRYLLEKAGDVPQAISMLMDLPVASNCNILLADRRGRMAVAECTPTRKRIREAERFGEGAIVCAVNSFTSDEMKPFDDAKGQDYHSRERYAVVMDSFASGKIGGDAETIARLLRGEYGFMCQYEREADFETVWSSIFDLESLVIHRAEGDPRRAKFNRDRRLCAR